MATTDGDDISFGRKTMARLWQAIRSFLGSEVGGRAGLMGLGLLALLLAINGLNVVNSYVGRDFMTAIQQRDQAGFVRQALFYVGVFALSTVAAVVYRFTEERLGLLWRDWLTHRLVRTYLEGRLYYRLHVSGLANPDQRIADDVRSLATSTLSLCLIFLNGSFTIVAFSGVLWSISHLLFIVAVGYAAIGSLLAIYFGRPLVRLNYDQSDREAAFRADLVHVRENSDSVALFGREPYFARRLHGRVEALVANMRRIVAVNRNLGFFTTGYNYMIQLIPPLIVAPMFIAGSAQFGEIPQASMAFAMVVGAFSVVVNQFGQLSSYAAVLARLSALAEASDTAPPLGTASIAVVDGAALAVEGLTLRAHREDRVLVRDLSLAVPPGERRLVVGSPDTGAALERAIAGMWPAGEGRIVRPADVMFLPERPYLPPGPLLESLPPARAGAPPSEDDLWAALRAAGVESAVRRAGGLRTQCDWDDTLSLQEQRLVEVARMLLVGPSGVVLTRLAANLGAVATAAVVDALAARGIGCLALESEAPSGTSFADVVTIAADGSWSRNGAKAAVG